MEKFNVILGSGGVKGFCHVGFLKAISELNLKINKIAGLSVGALVATMYVNGWDYKEIGEWFINVDFVKLLKRPTYKIIIDTIKHKRIMPVFDAFPFCDELVKKYLLTPKENLYIVTTNFTKRKMEYYNKSKSEANNIDFTKLLCSSMSIPGLFQPVEINNCIYVDGGTMVGNCPVDLFTNGSDDTNIAVQISYLGEKRQKIGLINNLMMTLELTQQKLFYYQVEKSKKEILVIPDCNDLLATDFNISKEDRYRLMKLGYDKTMEVFKSYE